MSPQIWGGIECTLNRVGNVFHDQLSRSGHLSRVDDIDRIAALGIRTLRYPLLWEKIAPDLCEPPMWSSSDLHLLRMLERGIRPIAGLVHHGSGPGFTDLLDPQFPVLLARYARKVAERYPWIDTWTPINEPLATARFSGLYGHWYPHHRSDTAFTRIVVNECKAIVLAMRAIRTVHPGARYLHTDDVGVITSTPGLNYQATFENARQRLALDLLTRRVDAHHALWPYLHNAGMTEVERDWFLENEIAPNLIGADYYTTSDRYLDSRWDRYPSECVGGNARERYVDVASHGCVGWKSSLPATLRSLHSRYGIPLVLGEVHRSGFREQQLSWIQQAWATAQEVEGEGVPLDAVVFWSLLGSFDWDDLVRVERGHYETGAFDVRSGVLRPTAVATAIGAIAATGGHSHPVLWAQPVTRSALRDTTASRASGYRPILILGAGGTLGRAFIRRCEARQIGWHAMTRDELDISRRSELTRVVGALKPWAVVNASGYVSVDAAELDHITCRRVNVDGAANVAYACQRYDAALVTFSSDLVFDGGKMTPYVESDKPAPLSVYGTSKFDGEQAVLAEAPGALVIRTSAFFGNDDKHNFVVQTLGLLASGQEILCSSSVVSPTFVPALVDSTLDLLIDGAAGVWHQSSAESLSWAELARSVARLAGFDDQRVQEASQAELGYAGRRPAYSVLGSKRGSPLPELHASLASVVRTWMNDR